ncbi:DUF63 family protein [Natrialbaceae archaeon GCM10025810]|uniref:DUF63 family protein n=1 Tax=Halovalidus salilacus TaxID=3075124 RepID=UPI00361B5E39
MDDVIDRIGPERAWAATVLALVAALVVGSIAFPQRVYVEFVWQYFWGPVVADAHGWSCVAWAGGEQVNCADAPAGAGPTAAPGYTPVSYAGYIPTLILLLIGIVYLIRWLDVRRYRAGFFALFPFVLFGGALRVVEDVNATTFGVTGDLVIPMPWVGFLISPLIYFTVFFITLVALVVSIWLDRNGYVSGYEYPLAGFGALAFGTTFGYLGYVAVTETYVGFNPSILALVVGVATVSTAIVWVAIERFEPEVNVGTGLMGVIVIWAHAIDGAANWLMLDWAHLWDLRYSPKHPANEAIVSITEAVLPAAVTDVTGAAWTFFLVKLAVPVAVIWLFDDTLFEENPRFATLLLVTVVAVGLGPGTRDMLRATFGV